MVRELCKTGNSLKIFFLAKKSWLKSSLQSWRTYWGRQLGRPSCQLPLERTTNGCHMVVTYDFGCRNMVVPKDFGCRNMVVPNNFCCRNMVVSYDFGCRNKVVSYDSEGSTMVATYDFSGSNLVMVVTCRNMFVKQHGRAQRIELTPRSLFSWQDGISHRPHNPPIVPQRFCGLLSC